MTKLSRRSFVAALATSMTAAAQASSTVSEHPDLLAMADRLPGVLQDYRNANERVAEIEKVWGPQWPTVDPKIVKYGGTSKRHEDILGRGIKTEWGKSGIMKVQHLGTPECFEAAYLAHTKEAERKSKFKSQRGMRSELRSAERSKAQIEPARAYWSEVERIEKLSGIRNAQDELKRSRNALTDLVGKILTFEEQSVVGLGIKVEAMAAFSELPMSCQRYNLDAPEWLTGVVASLNRAT